MLLLYWQNTEMVRWHSFWSALTHYTEMLLFQEVETIYFQCWICLTWNFTFFFQGDLFLYLKPNRRSISSHKSQLWAASLEPLPVRWHGSRFVQTARPEVSCLRSVVDGHHNNFHSHSSVERFKVNPVQLWFWPSLVLIGLFCHRVRRVRSHRAVRFVFGLGQKLTKQVQQQ